MAPNKKLFPKTFTKNLENYLREPAKFLQLNVQIILRYQTAMVWGHTMAVVSADFSTRKVRLDAFMVSGVIKRTSTEGAWRAGAYRALQKAQRDRRRFYRSQGNLLEEVLLRCAGVSACTIANKFQQLSAERPLSFSAVTWLHLFLVLFLRTPVPIFQSYSIEFVLGDIETRIPSSIYDIE